MSVLQPVISLGLSVGLHLVLASPALLWMYLFAEPLMETPGEEGDAESALADDGGEVAEGVPDPTPVSVSLYVEPTAVSEVVETVEPAAVPAPAPQPAAKPSPVEGTAEGDPNTTTISPAEKAGIKGRRPRGERKPCEPIEEITSLAEDRWRVERDVVDYYAAHLRELQKQVAVSTHQDGTGKPDGVRVFLSRCSLLRQAGIRHGDVIHSVNGRRVATLTDGIAAYLLLRNEDNLRVELTRKNGDRRTHHYRLKR
jgi:hypothetical protein